MEVRIQLGYGRADDLTRYERQLKRVVLSVLLFFCGLLIREIVKNWPV